MLIEGLNEAFKVCDEAGTVPGETDRERGQAFGGGVRTLWADCVDSYFWKLHPSQSYCGAAALRSLCGA